MHWFDRRHSDPLDVGDHPGRHWGLSGNPRDGRARGRRPASLLLTWPWSSDATPARRRSREVRHEPPLPARGARYQGRACAADAGKGDMSNLRTVESQRSRASRVTAGLPVLRLSHRVLPAQWTDFYSLLMLASDQGRPRQTSELSTVHATDPKRWPRAHRGGSGRVGVRVFR